MEKKKKHIKKKFQTEKKKHILKNLDHVVDNTQTNKQVHNTQTNKQTSKKSRK